MDEGQFGFVRQKSTADALHSLKNFIDESKRRRKSVLLISLDIQGAFDSASWPLIIGRLIRKNCPLYLVKMVESYFSDRYVLFSYGHSKIEVKMTQGCPQGSVCGPSFWNLLIDSLLISLKTSGLLNEDDSLIQAYADDCLLAISFWEDQRVELEIKLNEVLDFIFTWGSDNLLTFNSAKTSLLYLPFSRGGLSFTEIRFGDSFLEIKPVLKYLGVWFDTFYTFEFHVSQIVDKAYISFARIKRFCYRTWGPGAQTTSLLYSSLIVPILSYASSIFVKVLLGKGKIAERCLQKVRRLNADCCKCVTKSYSTVSFVNNFFFSGLLPLEYEIFMRSQIEICRISGRFSPQLVNFGSDLEITNGGLFDLGALGIFDCPKDLTMICSSLPPFELGRSIHIGF